MSIVATLSALEAEDKLVRYIPTSSRRKPGRRLYLTKQANKDRTAPNSAVNILMGSTGRAFIEAALTLWTLGDQVYGNDEGKCRFMCRLEPPPLEIWDVRVTEPRPQARLFGRFIEPNTLVLTNFHTRDFLGKKGSVNWAYAMNACETAWKSLFGDLLFVGNNIHDYVTENCDDFCI
jgi:hypothetical protein